MPGFPMFRRFLSALLIAAVVACPLWCEAGLVRCCAVDADAASAQKSDLPPCCQKQQPSHDTSPVIPGDAPADSREQCQGICGGALLEKPYQLDASNQVAVLPPESVALFSAIGLLDRPVINEIFEPPCCSGRMLRTLHRSLLC